MFQPLVAMIAIPQQSFMRLRLSLLFIQVCAMDGANPLNVVAPF
jgi:hypothetical protein